QWCGLAIWLLVCVIVVYSYVRGLRRTQIQASGRTPTMLRSPWLMLPLLAAYLVVLVLLWQPVAPGLSASTRLAIDVAGILLTLCGVVFILWGRFALGKMHNISSVSGARLFADHQLITAGPYKIVRHPMYLGFALAAAGALLLYRTWAVVFMAVHGLVFIVRARREEEALAARFGEDWRQYCRRVPAILPRLRRMTANETSVRPGAEIAVNARKASGRDDGSPGLSGPAGSGVLGGNPPLHPSVGGDYFFKFPSWEGIKGWVEVQGWVKSN
ncbi:MAG TPA: isoprenylcysteine carboxylmethyltransferase family protein, partial [Dissulfurispiraceae bacterium]